ncbi:MAG: HAD-IA family hydrolase [Candidatus Aenigmarchaeota archaeon]|nr:HAD-IA family hydrolase [Candidatus Aenigmarchaeota archaeon]
MKTNDKPVIMLDFGGVYFTHGRSIGMKRIARKFMMPEKTVAGSFSGNYYKKYHEGKAGPAEFWKGVSGKLKISRKQAREMEKIWFSSYVPLREMKQLVRKLRKKYRVVVLSGNIRERVRYLDRKYRVLKEFHGHHFSFDHGFAKPDVRLFKSAARKMRLRPAECIVVDDSKEFLEAVKKTGAKTIMFKNAKQLERALRNYGVHA